MHWLMKLFDLHEDFAWSSQFLDVIEGDTQSSLKLLSNFEKVTVVAAIYPHVRTYDERVEMMKSLYNRVEHSTVSSLEMLWNQLSFYRYLERSKGIKILEERLEEEPYGINFILSLEGTDALRHAYDLYLLHKLGIRVLGLTWNYDTKFAASCNSKKDYGLTGEGEEMVKIANSLGIIIDVSHASKRTLIDVCSSSKLPVIASHSNAKKLKEHPRNLDDEAIEAIARTGGVIGITAINSTLREASVKGIIDNINYIGENFGWDHVALGTDFLGIEDTPSGFENLLKVKSLYDSLSERADAVLWNNAARVLLKK